MNCIWDITRNYLIFKTNREPFTLNKRYLALNLRDKRHRQAAQVYAQNTPNLDLAGDLQVRIQLHEQIDDYWAQYHKAARHSDDPFWSQANSPQLPSLVEEERAGLYAKYEIYDRNVEPAQGDFFVLVVDEESAEVKAALEVLDGGAG